MSTLWGNALTAFGLVIPKTVTEATDAMIMEFQGREAFRTEVQTLKEPVSGAEAHLGEFGRQGTRRMRDLARVMRERDEAIKMVRTVYQEWRACK